MLFHSWLRTLRTVLTGREVVGNPTRGSYRQAVLFRPRLEVLEDRLTPAGFTVNGSTFTIILETGTSAADYNGFSLYGAIAAANAMPGANTIVLPTGHYQNPYATNQFGFPPITDELTIQGDGQGLTVIEDFHEIRTFDAYAKLTITGVTMQDGAGALNIHGGNTVSLSNCTLTGNNATGDGGAIYNSGTLIINSCVLSDNIATGKGGAIYNTGSLTIDKTSGLSTTLSGNSATSGGGIYTDTALTVELKNSIINDNHAVTGNGGGIETHGGTLTMTHCTVNGNTAYHYGGGVYVDPVVVTIIGCTFSGNSAPDGADVYNLDSSVTVISSQIASITNIGGTVTDPINDLLTRVTALNLNFGPTNSLTSTLQAAQQSLANASTTAAVNQLHAFINQVNALVNSHRLGAITANSLINEVDNLAELIG